MAFAPVIKQEPEEVPVIKYEPNEPCELKITNVFTITGIPVTESAQHFSTRLTSFQSYDDQCDHLHQPNVPQPARKRKQILKPIKKEDLLECKFCPTAFFSAESLEEHVVEIHFVNKECNCTECTKSISDQEDMGSRRKHPLSLRTSSSKNCLNRHRVSHDGKPYKCQSCPNSYRRILDLRIHEMNKHGKEKRFKCPKCPKSFARNYLLKVHLRSARAHSKAIKDNEQVESHRSFQCPSCPNTYSRIMDLKRHEIQLHGEEKKFKCLKCPKSYTRNHKLLKHISSSHSNADPSSPQLVYQNPRENFKAKENLKLQSQFRKRTISPSKQEDILKCDICSTVFFSVDSLEEHVVEMHVVDKEFSCTKCAKSFIGQDELDSHMAEHKKEEQAQFGHKCPICSRRFARRNLVNSHMLTHDAAKPFKCKLCPNKYARRSGLKCHEMKHHRKEKRFMCLKCPKSFAHNYALQDHIRTHSDAKTRVCKTCGANFKTNYILKYHILTACCEETSSKNKLSLAGKMQSKQCIAAENKTLKHHYKRYRCNVCDKVCAGRVHLGNHMTTHTNERNFNCKLCQTSYKRNSSLRAHLRRKHNTTEV